MLSGRILTPSGWITGSIDFSERIHRIIEGPAASGHTILPGFVDLHVHGAAGTDIMEGGNAGAVVARSHARHGTTSLLGTTLTAKEDHIRRALAGMAGMIAQRPAGAARMLGVHLEGPFLNLQRLGAQPPDVVPARLDLVRSLHAIAPIRVLTMAPEVDDNLQLIPQLAALGIRVQIGHSAGSYEDGVAALQ
uniref:amidohydrolase family protein n=1 Tax=uncultured Massilia sp. TaxID=169973 RepID=UPI002585224F